MTEVRVRTAIALLSRMAAEPDRLDKTASCLLHLLELAKMSTPIESMAISVQEQIEAGKFWNKLLGTNEHLSSPLLHKSARAYYAVVSTASRVGAPRELQVQALDYCTVIVGVCNAYLGIAGGRALALPPPVQKPRPELRVVGGTAVESIAAAE